MIEFGKEMKSLATDLLTTEPFTVGEWQSKDVSQVRQYDTYEIKDVNLMFTVPLTSDELAKAMDPYPNLTWADEHFAERVGGVPLNPAPSHARWPWGRHNGTHQDGPSQVFSHTYPERMWPRYAGNDHEYILPTGEHATSNWGIRFQYGDLQDVVNLLVRSPLTRQAYLPIWFPEDTGAAHRQRVPCTLGYHFMIRNGAMSCRYYMRSCDLVRHFADDVYLAARLLQWVCDQVTTQNPESEYTPSYLRMYIASLHAFAGDKYTLERVRDENVAPR
jgi:thymidylate synthase